MTVNRTEATHDINMFGANPKWTVHLKVWGEGAVVTVGKDSNMGNKGAKMMFVGYAEQESESVRMWDPSTRRVIVTHNVIWLKKLYFQPNDVAGMLELDAEEGLDNKSESDTAMKTFERVKLGGNIMGNPVVTEPTRNMVTRLG